MRGMYAKLAALARKAQAMSSSAQLPVSVYLYCLVDGPQALVCAGDDAHVVEA